MYKKILIVVGIIVILLSISLCGCNESINQSGSPLTAQEKIVGTWEFFTGSGSMYYFYSNGWKNNFRIILLHTFI